MDLRSYYTMFIFFISIQSVLSKKTKKDQFKYAVIVPDKIY